MSIMNEVHDIMSVRDQKEDVRMYNEFGGTLSNLALAKHRKKPCNQWQKIQEEKKGKGRYGRPVIFGPSRKGSPCLNDIASGQTVTLAEIEGPGAINHIWNHSGCETTDADCFVTERSGFFVCTGWWRRTVCRKSAGRLFSAVGLVENAI